MSLELFGPLGHRIQEQGEMLNRNFCQVKGLLQQIAENSRAQSMRNDWVHKYLRGENQEEASLLNDSGHGWIVHWIAGTSAMDIYRGAAHPSNFLLKLGAKEAELVCWYIPPQTNLTIKAGGGIAGYLTLQIEQVPVAGAAAAENASGELYEITRNPDPVPSAEVGLNGG